MSQRRQFQALVAERCSRLFDVFVVVADKPFPALVVGELVKVSEAREKLFRDAPGANGTMGFHVDIYPP
jgi:hypothetical protein